MRSRTRGATRERRAAADPHELRTVVLVEPGADQGGGHWGENLARLCAHDLADVRTIVVAHGPLHDDTGGLIRARADQVVENAGSSGPMARTLGVAARALSRLSLILRRRYPGRWLADQPILVARFLDELSCLLFARPLASGPADVVVVLTANEVLHTAARSLSRTWHLRFVHEFSMRHARAFGAVDHLTARMVSPPLVLCPTIDVRRLVLDETPHVPTLVQTFAVTSAAVDLASPSRVAWRREIGLPMDLPAIALLGSAWWYKDHEVLADALDAMSGEISVVLVGDQRDDALLARFQERLGEHLIDLGPSVRSELYSKVCAAVDAILISRRAGVGKESGLLMDAVRHQTGVIMSDNDPDLTELIGDRPWVRLFTTGDATSLQACLCDLTTGDVHRPNEDDAALLGMLSPAAAIESFMAHARSARRR